MKTTFSPCINRLLHSKTPSEEVASVKEVGQIYSQLLNQISLDKNSIDQTTIAGGVALSPQHAMDCLHDSIRTARFLKGVFKALKSVKKNNGAKIEILYAGCGPLATLIMPLLHLFSSKEMSITLLDIHSESINSVRNIAYKLQYQDFFKDFIVCDATQYSHGNPIDILITETMDKALTKEPQVTITKHLSSQIRKDGILIPEKITLYHNHTFFAKLPKAIGKDSEIPIRLNLTKEETELFSIDKNINGKNFNYQSDVIQVPENFRNTPDICIYTTIKVFDDVILYPCESLITNPYCIHNLHSIEDDSYKLVYASYPQPSWSVKETI